MESRAALIALESSAGAASPMHFASLIAEEWPVFTLALVDKSWTLSPAANSAEAPRRGNLKLASFTHSNWGDVFSFVSS